jgi:hypothetical protein
LAAASGNCAATCRQDVFYRTSIVGTPAAAFAWTGSVKATGAVYRVARANLTPTGASGSGTSLTPTAPVLAGAGDRLILRLAGAADDTFSATPPAGHVTDFTTVGGGATDAGGGEPDHRGAATTAAFTLTTNVAWLPPPSRDFHSQHAHRRSLGLRVDDTASGNDINAIGMRARRQLGRRRDRIPVYYGTYRWANTAGTNSAHLYDLYPCITRVHRAKATSTRPHERGGAWWDLHSDHSELAYGAFTQTISTTLPFDSWARQINAGRRTRVLRGMDLAVDA